MNGLITRLLITMAIMLASGLYMHADTPSKRDRDAWMKEITNVKNEYIAKKLDLTDDQKAKFIPLYNEMEKEVRKTAEDTRRMAREIKKKGDAATDLEYEKASEALFECKGRECAIEKKYLAMFKKILTPRQLFKLKDAEHDFTRKLMKELRSHKRDKNKKDNKSKAR
ncbi:MAG: hypothetical protein HFJ91_03415 [Muribaculaceae bacterium]|nr:hypothetical protein [Muribaculaceae bacterium]